MSALRFAGPFVFLAAVPLLYGMADLAPLAMVPALLLSLLGAHHLPDRHDKAPDGTAGRVLPALYIPLQLIAIAWAAYEVTVGETSNAGFISLAIATGVCMGVFGVLAAHEMVHSRNRWQRWLGAVVLTAMSYRHFRIAHIYGHHRFAATWRDPSTARRGEGFYGFLLRTVFAQAIYAWRFEQYRVRNMSVALLRNRVLQDVSITALVCAAAQVFMGLRAVEFLAAESAVAIVVLELFNYVAHYGMLRAPQQPMHDHLSWNSSGAANLLLFNMGRHSHHHRAPALAYEGLCPVAAAPELPGGYAGAILLASIPPLWRRVMDVRLEKLFATNGGHACDRHASPVAVAP